MKMIDEKGRLFGRINIIDFLVILFLICIMPAFYFGYKVYAKTKKPEVQMPVQVEVVEINCQFVKVRPELLKVISVGDKELNDNGQTIGEILSLGKIEPYEYKLDIGKGQELIKRDAFFKQIETKLKLKAKIKGKTIYYRDKEIKVGLPFEFETDKYKVVAIPSFKEKVERVKSSLRIKFSNLTPELAKIIKPGDKQIEVIEAEADVRRDVAKIIKVVSNQPSEVISLMGDKREWSIVGHPKYRDVVLEIEMSCVRKPVGLFKGNVPVKIGGPFTFSTDIYSISGMILGIEIR